MSEGAASEGGKNKAVSTVIFAAAMIFVVGVFVALDKFSDPPPNMPGDLAHKLNFNTSGELIGVAVQEKWPTTDAEGKPLATDKKSQARRVNLYCATCHGAPPDIKDEEFIKKGVCAVPEKCLANFEHHPPKATCIKCHRMPPRGAATKAPEPSATPTALPAPPAVPMGATDGGAAKATEAEPAGDAAQTADGGGAAAPAGEEKAPAKAE